MRENRQQARTRLLKLIKVRTAEDKKLYGHVVDISIGGMLIHSSHSASEGDYLNVSVELPPEIHPTPLDIHGEVTWASGPDKHNGYQLGCRFTAIEKSAQDALLRLAETYPLGEEEL